MGFGERVKSIMEAKNITQKQLSEKSGITAPSLCRYLKGETQPRRDIIINLAKALEVNVSYLMGVEDNMLDAKNETITVVARNRDELTDADKAEIIRILLGGN